MAFWTFWQETQSGQGVGKLRLDPWIHILQQATGQNASNHAGFENSKFCLLNLQPEIQSLVKFVVPVHEITLIGGTALLHDEIDTFKRLNFSILFHTFSLLFILQVILRCHFRFPDLCKPRTKSSKPRIPRLDFGFVVWKNWEMLRCSRSTKGSFQAPRWAAQFPDHLRASFVWWHLTSVTLLISIVIHWFIPLSSKY